MKCLVVVAHPVPESLSHALANIVVNTLRNAGHDVEIEDLYQNEFEPALTPNERQSYYRPPFDAAAVQTEVEHLRAAEALVLVFPTWWFGFPAILKGWFDRVWAPGVAYEHASDFGPIKPGLNHLRFTLAITSLGSPWWVDCLVMRQPVRRILKTAILRACAPACKFKMLSLYKAEQLSIADVKAFRRRIKSVLEKWSHT
jgi:putative NADPH-quinone reductase